MEYVGVGGGKFFFLVVEGKFVRLVCLVRKSVSDF